MSEQAKLIDSKPSNKVLLIEKIRGGGSNDFISPEAMEKLNKLMKEGEEWRYLKKDNADYYLDGKLFHTDFLRVRSVRGVEFVKGNIE